MTLTEDELTKPERCLCQKTAAGRPLDLRKGNPALDDPMHGADWDAARTVRAELLIELLTGTRQPEAAPYARAVKLVGARIIGTLDLEAATLVCPMLLQGCYFDEPINLREAQAPVVRLPACHVPSLVGDQLETRGNLELDQGFTAYGGVSLWGAHIGGLLSLDGAQLSNHDGPALDISAVTVDGVLICRDGFTARGEVRLIGAHIGGSLAFSGANLSNPEGLALHGLELAVDGYMYCHQGFTTQGQVMLLGARIGGMLLFNGARLSNPSGLALEAARVSVDDGLFCGEGFTADGQVSLWGAQIGGKLVFEGAQLSNPDGTVLDLSGVTVGASLVCSGLTTQGEVCLASAHIGGALDLSGARLTNPGGQALNADGITIGQSAHCGEGFTAEGEVRLLGGQVGGFLDFRRARLANPGSQALVGHGLTVNLAMFCGDGFTVEGELALPGAHIGSMLDLAGACLSNRGGEALDGHGLTVQDLRCRDGFTAEGEVRLQGAHISRQLRFDGAHLANPQGLALDLAAAQVTALYLQPREPPDGVVDLTNARVGSFYDDPATWPAVVRLGGLVYETLEADQLGVRARLGWVRRDPSGYTPQVYEQLAAAYRRAGQDEAAREVLIAKQWHRRQTLNLPGKLWNWLLYVTVGYGYRAWLAGLWLVGLLAVGSVVFDRAYPTQMVAGSQPTPPFHPVAYTLDVLLPVVDLGQQGAWIPQGTALAWSWALTGAGWILTTAVVAGLARILQRD